MQDAALLPCARRLTWHVKRCQSIAHHSCAKPAANNEGAIERIVLHPFVHSTLHGTHAQSMANATRAWLNNIRARARVGVYV
jgi:hypothetical protein